VRIPTLAILLGEGGSGGAVALLPGDRVLCAEHGVLTPMAPEGASAILYRNIERARERAATQAISSVDLLRHGIVDAIVPEHPAASQDPNALLARLGDAVHAELGALLATGAERLGAREARYRRTGERIRKKGE
jgi:acetyl-CoA carboxylase alpha subunit